MPDPRLEQLAASAERRTRLGEFTPIAARGRRRRRATRATAALSVAVVVAAITVGVTTVTGSDATPTPPSHSPIRTLPTRPTPTKPSGTLPVRGLTAKQIALAPKAQLQWFAADPDNPAIRASAWSLCEGRSCSREVYALAVTDDGFHGQSAFVRLTAYSAVTWAGDSEFVATTLAHGLSLVSSKGRVEPVSVTSHPSPVLTDQVLVMTGSAKVKSPSYVAVNVSSRTAHPIPLPADPAYDIDSLNQQPAMGTTLSGAETDVGDTGTTVISSSNGGATWRAPLRVTPSYISIGSGSPSVLAFIVMGDDTVLDAHQLDRSLNAGVTWQTIKPPQFRNVIASWAVVTPSGDLLVAIVPHAVPHQALPGGLYVSDDQSWTHFHRIAVQAPPHTDITALDDFQLATLASDKSQTLYARQYGPGQDHLLMSTDEGRTWTSEPSR